MKILALMMFLASSLAFSHPAEPADLVDSASPACQEIASSVVDCRDKAAQATQYICTAVLPPAAQRCRVIDIQSISCSADMEDYLLCEISEIKTQTVDRLQRIKDVLTGKRFRELVVRGNPSYLLYKYLKKKAEQKKVEQEIEE